MDRLRKVLVFVGLVVLVQLAVAVGGKSFWLTQLTMAGWYSLVVVGLCLLMGYAGQISLGHAGFFAIGGYVQAVLTTVDLGPAAGGGLVRLARAAGLLAERQDLYGAKLLSFSPWASLVAALLAAAVVAWLIGVPVLRLKGHYLAMATLGFGLIVYRIVLGTPVFGEADGLTGVPPFRLFLGLRVSGEVPARVANYYIAWVLVALALLLALNLLHSRAGRALGAIHDGEEAAAALGVDTGRYKLQTFVLSAVLAAVGGAFLTHFNGGIGPSEAATMKSIRYVAIVAVGGMANLWGTVAAGVLLNFLSLRGVFGSYDDAVFGAVLILVMLFRPAGLLPSSLPEGWRRAAAARLPVLLRRTGAARAGGAAGSEGPALREGEP